MTSKSTAKASWSLELAEGEYSIEFEHGSTSGKRIIRINGKEISKRDWMFRLVGSEVFTLGRSKCEITVEPSGTLGFSYGLIIDGVPLKTFDEIYRKRTKTWNLNIQQKTHRVVLEKDAMDIWVDGTKTQTTSSFTDNGSEIKFTILETPCIIKSSTSGNKKEGLVYTLHVDDKLVENRL